MDFSENMDLDVRQREVQSAHWSSKTATLFLTMLYHLDKERWEDKTSSLKHGDEVSVRRHDGLYEFATIDEQLDANRSEEHTSELQSLMRISYAVFCLKKKK